MTDARYYEALLNALDGADLNEPAFTRVAQALANAEAAAAEKAWDEGAEAALDYVMFRDTNLRNEVPGLNPYRQPAKGDGNGG